jgi:hypothetical protein
MEVMRARFDDGSGWTMQGFALPVLVPDVASLSWDAVSELRSDPILVRLRSALLDLETEALEAAAAGQDLTTALHRCLNARMQDELKGADALGANVAIQLAALVVGVGTSIATAGLAGPAAIALGTGAAALTSGGGLYQLRRARRRHSWLRALGRVQMVAAGRNE